MDVSFKHVTKEREYIGAFIARSIYAFGLPYGKYPNLEVFFVFLRFTGSWKGSHRWVLCFLFSIYRVWGFMLEVSGIGAESLK